MATSLFSIILVTVASFIGSFGAIFLKKGSKHFALSVKGLLKNWELILGLSLYIVPTILFIFALRKAELSVLYPFVATVYVWTSIFSVKLLGEKMNRWKWAGIAAILLGVSLIGLGS